MNPNHLINLLNQKYIQRFLAITHNKQAYRSEDNEASEVKRHSLLSQMLPEAMVAYLENHGPDKFAQIFLGKFFRIFLMCF